MAPRMYSVSIQTSDPDLCVALEDIVKNLRRVLLAADLAGADVVLEALAVLAVEHAEVQRVGRGGRGDRLLEVGRVVVGREVRDLVAIRLEGVDLVERRAGAIGVDHGEAVV